MTITLTADKYRNIADRLSSASESSQKEEEIAAILGYPPEEFKEILESYPEFPPVIALGKARAEYKIQEMLYKKATLDGNMEALKFMAYHRLGLEDNKSAVKVNKQSASLNLPLSHMTTPQLIALLGEDGVDDRDE